MKVSFIVLISESKSKEAEAELKDFVRRELSQLKHWKLEKHKIIESEQ